MTILSLLRTSLISRVSITATLLIAAPATADVKSGVDAWSRGDYPRAVAEWKGPAERGDADAQFNLGQAYKLGRGVPVDLARAEELFSKAAAKGHFQAADNYGLLLFQRGERVRAMPYIKAASDRGDPRSQYLLGIAHFNGDTVVKDWVRAYALVSLAQQAGLAQAAPALAQMDKYIPIEQRQQSVALASDLAGAAQATRTQQLAAMDLGATVDANGDLPAGTPTPTAGPEIASAQNAVATAARITGKDSPRTAGADYARPAVAPQVVTLPRSNANAPVASATAAPATPASSATVKAPATAPASATAQSTSSGWRIQLGAFGVRANADALWERVKSRPELSGRTKVLVPAGRISKLQAAGFANQAEARATCSRLVTAGFACLAVRN
jgi:uncharacterized protein